MIEAFWWDEVGTPGASATHTTASAAIALTRAPLNAVARTSAATEVTLAWLTGVARGSGVIEVRGSRPSQVTTSGPIWIPTKSGLKISHRVRMRPSDLRRSSATGVVCTAGR